MGENLRQMLLAGLLLPGVGGKKKSDNINENGSKFEGLYLGEKTQKEGVK